MNEKDKKYPEGHFVGMWIGIGLAIFTVFGISLSIATGNTGLIGIGPAIGVAIGVAIGQSIEDKHKKEGRIRPLTKEEKDRKKKLVFGGIVLLVLGIVSFLTIFLLR